MAIDYARKSKETKQKQAEQDKISTDAKAYDKHTSDPVTAISEKVNNGNIVMMGVRITQEQKDFMKRLAVDNHTTISNIIRELVSRIQSGDITIL